MNVIDVVEKVTGHVIVMREEGVEAEAEVIHQGEDIHLVDRDLEVIQVDLVQDLDLDQDQDLARVVQDLEVIQDPTLVIVEAEEDLEVVLYVILEVVDLALTQEKDHILQDLNPHVLDPEVDLDLIQNHHLVQDLALDLAHTVAHALIQDLVLEVILVLAQDLVQDHHLLNLIHQQEVKMEKNQWMKIKK